jgi:SAM-dependent methyltransferase
LREAERAMLAEFSVNQWFLQKHWPENRARVRRILGALLERYPQRRARVLDVGCFNGYISLMARLLGFEVTGSDAEPYADRDVIFEKFGIGYVSANLNEGRPFAELADKTFDAVIFAEIFEHILNHPLGVLQDLARLLKPDGLLVLTTPNPSTVANAARILLDRHSLWGTLSFGEVQKFDGGGAICRADIHYREYRTCELTALLARAGFSVRQVQYMSMGSPVHEAAVKRMVKQSCGFLLRRRPFANTQFIVATT